jgi:ribosome-interacting GTPase 1
MARTQKNKATAHHMGMLKAKLAKLRRELITPKGSGGASNEGGFDVAKTGDARIGLVGMVGNLHYSLSLSLSRCCFSLHGWLLSMPCQSWCQGFPSVGKSTLLNKLTGTFSEIASYEFTTLTCVPGVIYYRGAKLQVCVVRLFAYVAAAAQ